MDRRGFVSALGAGTAALGMRAGALRAQEAGPAKLVLEGVPKVQFGQSEHGGSISFPSSLATVMHYLGEDPAYDYTYLLGTSGAAFAMLWGQEPWTYIPDLTDPAISASWLEPVERAFRSVGYGFEYVHKGEGEAPLRERIVASIRNGLPVLATAIVGPGTCGIITGYDEGGAVMVGWSYFQGMAEHGEAEDFEPCGYYRKRGWYADAHRALFIGPKGDDPPVAETYGDALQWAVELAEMETLLDCHCGPAAYAAWAEAQLNDDDFPEGDLEALLERVDCNFGAIIAVEARRHAAMFLRRAAEHTPDLAELDQAAAAYDAEAEALLDVYKAQGASGPHDESGALGLSDRARREEMASLILKAGEHDAEAVGHIRVALAE